MAENNYLHELAVTAIIRKDNRYLIIRRSLSKKRFPGKWTVVADYNGGKVKLQEEETDQFAWVTTEEAKSYDLIDGIREEFVMADSLSKGKRILWQRFS